MGSKKVFAYIDGFNLYHHLNDYLHDNNLSKEYKSLDVRKLVSHFLLPNERLDEIFYFSAIPKHLTTSKILKHEAYYNDLRKICNVAIIDGRFGKKCSEVRCLKCNKKFLYKHHEEKETDVSLGIKIVADVLMKPNIDKIILLSADSDFIPVVNFILENTNKEMTVLLPVGAKRKNHFSTKNADVRRYKHARIKESHIKSSKISDTTKRYNP